MFNIIADCIFVLILLISFIIGYKKGFIGLVVGFLAGILTLVLATLLAKPLAEAIGAMGLRAPLENAFAGLFDGELFTTPLKELAQEQIKEMLASLSLPDFIVTAIDDVITTKISEVNISDDLTVQSILSTTLANYALTAIAWVILTIVLGIVFFLLKRFSKVFNKIPLVGKVNKLLGGLTSAIIAFALVIVLMYLFSLIGTLLPESAVQFVESCTLLGWIYHVNPLGHIITALLV